MRAITCTVCRRKKRKCDGTCPCAPCVKYGSSDECKIEVRCDVTAARGPACLPCRKKKKKCNGATICNVCRATGREMECIYKDSLKGIVLRSKDLSLQDNLELAPRTTATRTVASPPGALLGRSLRTTEHPSRCNRKLVSPSFKSEISETSLDDLCLAFRMCFISHRLQLGLVLNYEQQRAIVHGDLFSSAIHPVFIHFSHILGCHYYQELKSDFMLLYLQSVYVYMTVESLSTIKEDKQPLTRARATFLLAEMYLYTHHLDFGTRYLKLAHDIVKRNNIKFLMRPGTAMVKVAQPFFEEVHERIAFLAQLLYVDTDLFLVAGQPPIVSAELAQEFRFDLPLAHPSLCKSCTILVRTKGALIIKDVIQHLQELDRQVIATKAWYSMSYSLLQDMSAHIDDTRSLMSRIDQAQDQERRVCLIYSMITCWTSVAQLHDAMALQEHDSLQLCRKAVSEVLVWTRELRDKDYFLLDPFVGICWSRAMKLLKKDGSVELPTAARSSDSDLRPEHAIKTLVDAKARLDISIRLVPSGPGSLCAKLVAMNEKLRTRCPDRIAPDEVNQVYRY